MDKQGLKHVYYGDGKGKTTAALGQALRAAGQGLRVVIAQFFKTMPTGEVDACAALPAITILRSKEKLGFIFKASEEEKSHVRQVHDALFKDALALVSGGQCDMLVLDEGMDALSMGLVDESLFNELIANKPAALELVITGHKPVEALLQSADYVTEMVKHKHPYDHGISARRGIEY